MSRAAMEQKLFELFERERDLLLAGRLDDLGECARAKAALGDISHLPPESLFRLQTLAKRNAALLEAAGRGLRAAARRVTEFRSGAVALKTYGADGRRHSPQGIGAQPIRRA